MLLPTSPPLRLDDRTIVGRLRLQTSGHVDAASAKRRLESVLGEIGLGDAGLPASALLCIRSLRDPLPGTLPLGWNARPPAEWKQALDGEIARAARGAARPIDGAVPAGHEAVLFRDRAELLACLALDWMRGEIAARWWWQHLLRGNATERIAPTQWVVEAPYVPAAARALADRGALVSFAAALEREEARLIVAAIDAAFGVESTPAARSLAGLGSAMPITGRPTDVPGGAAATTAWSQWVPEADAPQISNGPARAFVAMSLGLVRASGVVRRPEMRAVVERWLGGGDEPRPSEARGEARRPNEPTAEAQAVESMPALVATPRLVADSFRASRTEAPAPERAGGEPHLASAPTRVLVREVGVDVAPAAESALLSLAKTPRSEDGAVPLLAPGAPAAPASVPSGVKTDDPESGPHDTGLSPPPPPPPSGAERPLPRPTTNGIAIGTGLGGAFFLVNVLLALDIYGDFTRPRSRAVEASPWTLIAHLTRALLSEAGSEVADDALWWILRDLAGATIDREAWPSELRLQPEWLLPFPDRSHWTWSVRDDRFRVEHPRGFVVVDVPAEADVASQRARELASYEVADAAEAPGALPLGSWPELLALFVRARIHAALRAESPGASVRLALTLRARVRATDSHVDVHAALAELPIEVRLAGLDRNPGWIPAAGRFLAFHFD